jgi:glucose-6-phosphate dehydrogenase assembly protein OpcA
MLQLTSDAIENQLMLMWRQVASAAQASGALVVARSSVLTLVVYTGGNGRSERVCRQVDSIIAQVAARGIVLVPEPAAPGGAPIAVTLSVMQTDAAGNPAHGERILIQAHDDAVRHLPGAVLPLILSGLPAFLWWTGEPPWRTELFEAMVDGCDRLLVDTSDVTQAERALVGLSDLMKRKKASCAITDLNWMRQMPWRELVAQFFDDPNLLPYLAGLDRVTIEYAAGAADAPIDPAQAYLFAGWLASRLGWQSRGTYSGRGIDAAREHTLVTAQGRSITVELSARYGVAVKPWSESAPQGAPQAAPNGAPLADPAQTTTAGRKTQPPAFRKSIAVGPGALMSVYLHAAAGGKAATFTVARESDLQHASTRCSADCAPPSQTVHLPTVGEEQSIIQQLQVLGHDVVYEEALAAAASLLAPAGRRNSL